jgi:hypothetical protein
MCQPEQATDAAVVTRRAAVDTMVSVLRGCYCGGKGEVLSRLQRMVVEPVSVCGVSSSGGELWRVGIHFDVMPASDAAASVRRALRCKRWNAPFRALTCGRRLTHRRLRLRAPESDSAATRTSDC